MHLRFEYFEAFEERQDHKPHTLRGLVPIFSRDAESVWKGGGIKHVAHDVVSSCLVSLLLAQNSWCVRRKISGEKDG